MATVSPNAVPRLTVGARVLFAAAVVALGIGCEVEPVCDGERQEAEEVPDAPFDADGDGFVDGSIYDCSVTYLPEELDCDDTNPDVSPDKLEITCNGIDDDCEPSTSDIDARGCVESYSGTWALEQPVAYTCGLGAVDVDFDRLLLQHAEPVITATALGDGPQPPPVEGTVTAAGVFLGTVEESGACPRTWTLEGRFVNPNVLNAQLILDVPEIPACLSCVHTTLDFTATRQIDL